MQNFIHTQKIGTILNNFNLILLKHSVHLICLSRSLFFFNFFLNILHTITAWCLNFNNFVVVVHYSQIKVWGVASFIFFAVLLCIFFVSSWISFSTSAVPCMLMPVTHQRCRRWYLFLIKIITAFVGGNWIIFPILRCDLGFYFAMVYY